MHVDVQTTYCMRSNGMHVDVQNTLTVITTQGRPQRLHVNVQSGAPRKGRGGGVVGLHVNVQIDAYHWRRNGLHVNVQNALMEMATQGRPQRLHVNVHCMDPGVGIARQRANLAESNRPCSPSHAANDECLFFNNSTHLFLTTNYCCSFDDWMNWVRTSVNFSFKSFASSSGISTCSFNTFNPGVFDL